MFALCRPKTTWNAEITRKIDTSVLLLFSFSRFHSKNYYCWEHLNYISSTERYQIVRWLFWYRSLQIRPEIHASSDHLALQKNKGALYKAINISRFLQIHTYVSISDSTSCEIHFIQYIHVFNLHVSGSLIRFNRHATRQNIGRLCVWLRWVVPIGIRWQQCEVAISHFRLVRQKHSL